MPQVGRASVRLSGWKEIAAHLGRGVRTAQRWEKDFGLPVRRIGFGRIESVFAFSAELDAWLASSAADSARAESDRVGSDPAESSSGAARQNAGPQPAPLDVQPAGPVRLRQRRALALAAALAAASVLGGFGYAMVLRLWVAPRAVTGMASNPTARGSGEPVSLRAEFDTLVALDASGTELWRHVFGFQLSDALYGPGRLMPQTSIGIVDIDGNGHRDVLVSTWPQDPNDIGRLALWAFNTNGTVRWSYQLDARTAMQFGAERFGGPWRIDKWFVTAAPENPSRRALWVTSHHSLMFPSALQRLDPTTGAPMSTYWSNGYIQTLSLATIGDRACLLVGASNNETRGGSLAILDASRPVGAAPSALPKYRCTTCPAGEPLAFVVFPKPRPFATMDIPSAVFQLQRTTDGFVVGVRHASGTDTLAADVYYWLDDRFQPRTIDVGDGYALVYQALVRQKAIPDGGPILLADQTPDFAPVLRWSGSRYAPVGRAATAASAQN